MRRVALGLALALSCAGALLPPAQAALFSCGQIDPVRDAFERLRANYVNELDGSLLIEAAIKGMESAVDRNASSPTAKQLADTAPPTRVGLFSSCGQAEAVRAAFERLRANDGQRLDSSLLIEAAINGMVSVLDRHSSYLTAKDLAENEQITRGDVGGIGLQFMSDRGILRIVSPIEGSPAALGGIRPADTMFEIDGQPLEGFTLDKVVRMLRGPVGSEVSLRIVRSGESQPVSLTLTRAVVRVESVKHERKGDIGYIRISSFSEKTDARVQRGIGELKEQIGPKLKGYVLDLRHNPGGLLDQGIRVADDFLTEGQVVSTRGRTASDNNVYRARRGDATDGKPIVVLINEGSAGSSEIVAGALQDNRRATIIGMKSFGLASVQTIISLSGNTGALRLTTANFYVPSGRAMEPAGIEPDILVSQSADVDANPVDGARQVIRPEPGQNYDDFQLSYALERLNTQ